MIGWGWLVVAALVGLGIGITAGLVIAAAHADERERRK